MLTNIKATRLLCKFPVQIDEINADPEVVTSVHKLQSQAPRSSPTLFRLHLQLVVA